MPWFGDERERVRRVDRLRGDHRHDVRRGSIPAASASAAASMRDRGRRCGCPARPAAASARPGASCWRPRSSRTLALIAASCWRGVLPSSDSVSTLAAHLPGEAGDADHHEFVEIAARDRQEPQPFEQRVGGLQASASTRSLNASQLSSRLKIASFAVPDARRRRVLMARAAHRAELALRRQPCYDYCYSRAAMRPYLTGRSPASGDGGDPTLAVVAVRAGR